MEISPKDIAHYVHFYNLEFNTLHEKEKGYLFDQLRVTLKNDSEKFEEMYKRVKDPNTSYEPNFTEKLLIEMSLGDEEILASLDEKCCRMSKHLTTMLSISLSYLALPHINFDFNTAKKIIEESLNS